MDTHTIVYQNKEYIATTIPHIFIDNPNQWIVIAEESLNGVLYDDVNGYPDKEAQNIDEKIYGFVDKALFQFDFDEFLKKIKEVLD